MENSRQYLIAIIAAAVIAGICDGILGRKSVYRPAIRLICNLFVLLSILSPFNNVVDINFSHLFDSVDADAQNQVLIGSQAARNELSEIIIQQTETYIHDKATQMGVDLSVSVILNNDDIPIPVAVILEGSISPYAKSKMTDLIEQDIGISEDQQTWN